MGLKPRHTPKSIDAEMERRLAIIRQYVIQKLSILGVQAANHARTQRGYTDRTGNLVNSTGFIILEDGRNIFEDFQTTFTGGAKTDINGEPAKDGMQEGRNYLNEIAQQFSNFKGYALIIGAGMEYASTVEHLRGKNVLADTELWLRDEFPKMIAEIKRDVNNMKL